MVHWPWVWLPVAGPVRISTVVAAVLMVAVIVWRRRDPVLALVALLAWASAYEVAYEGTGALVHGWPLAPFVWMTGHWAIGASVIASGAALGAVGMLTSLFNGRSAWYSAARQLVFGCLAAGVTYGVGAVLGALQLAQVPKS